MDNDSININIKDSEVRRRKTKKKKSVSFSPGSIGEKIAEIQIKGRKMGTVDLPFFFIVAILLVFGIIMMFSASYAWAISEGYPGIYYAKRQILFGLGGLVAMFITSRIDYHIFAKKTIAAGIFIIALILMILVFTPLGRTHGNARRWLSLGIEFQPSEIMKFAIVTLFSLMLTNNRKRIGDFKKGVLPFVFILLLVTLMLMKQPHLSCTIIICLISVILLFIGGVKIHHLAGIGVGGILGLAAVVLYKMRVEGFS
ncbi:MAG: FtsW/RodA/SpoVE family cell cycle protein, partial [Oscillospiraceae bacterium]